MDISVHSCAFVQKGIRAYQHVVCRTSPALSTNKCAGAKSSNMLPVFQTNVSKRLKAPTGGARTPLRAAAGNGVPALPIKSYAFAPMRLPFPYQMAIFIQLLGRRKTIRCRFAMA